MKDRALSTSKPVREREVFELFAQDVALTVIPGSVENHAPPEPDILCEIKGRGRVAFELVELVDQDFREGSELRSRTHQALMAFLNAHPSVSDLGMRYADAFVWITFEDAVSLRDREGSFPALFRWLLEGVPAGFSGDDIDFPSSLAGIVSRVSIDRPRFGPEFDIGYGAYLGDPTFETIRRKLRSHRYESAFPMELLAYTTIHLLLPDDVWQAKFAQLLSDMLESSSFARLWVWSLSQRGQDGALKLVHPTLRSAADE